MAAPANNSNAAGKRVNRDRIKVDLSLSKRNGLLDLAIGYLANQGMQASDDEIKQFASDWFYQNFGKWLERQIEDQEKAIIL